MAIDPDDGPRARGSDALKAVLKEDLSALGVEELAQRIKSLESEIARSQSALDKKKEFKGVADNFFKK